MKARALIILFLFGCLVIAGCGGGGGGGGGLVVGAITGPATVNESVTVNYSVSPSGDSGYTYQWTVSPAGAGTLANATSATTTFTPNAVAADTAATISVSVTSASFGPVVATLAITIVDVPGIAVGSITGPATVSESATANYSISPSGDSGYTYQWTVTPVGAGTFTNGTTDTATFNPNPVGADTPATIQVEVNSTNFGPVNATLNITILDDVVVGNGWAATWGGGNDNRALDVYVGSSGDIYTTGFFDGGPVDFDPGPGVDNQWAIGDDPFLSKIDSDGNYVWSLQWGGGLDDYANGVAEDSSGNVYVVGTFEGPGVNFDPAGWVFVSAACTQDAYLVKFDTDGNFQWVQTWASTNVLGIVEAVAIRIDSSDNIYVGGNYFMDTDFDPTAGLDVHSQIGGEDIFVSKFDPTPSHLWTAVWGSAAGDDELFEMDINATGDLWAVGLIAGSCDYDPGAGSTTYPLPGLAPDAFINHLDTSGTFQWARVWGGPTQDAALGVTVDSVDSSYITGLFQDTVDFNPGAGSASETSVLNSLDAFLSKFDAGGTFLDHRVWGGPNPDNEISRDVGVDASGNIYVSGGFMGTIDLDPGPGVDSHTTGGGFISVDIYISKFDSSMTYLWGRDWGAGGAAVVIDEPLGLDLDATGNIITCGYFMGTIDFDPSIGVETHVLAGVNSDSWLMKLMSNGDW